MRMPALVSLVCLLPALLVACGDKDGSDSGGGSDGGSADGGSGDGGGADGGSDDGGADGGSGDGGSGDGGDEEIALPSGCALVDLRPATLEAGPIEAGVAELVYACSDLGDTDRWGGGGYWYLGSWEGKIDGQPTSTEVRPEGETTIVARLSLGGLDLSVGRPEVEVAWKGEPTLLRGAVGAHRAPDTVVAELEETLAAGRSLPEPASGAWLAAHSFVGLVDGQPQVVFVGVDSAGGLALRSWDWNAYDGTYQELSDGEALGAGGSTPTSVRIDGLVDADGVLLGVGLSALVDGALRSALLTYGDAGWGAAEAWQSGEHPAYDEVALLSRVPYLDREGQPQLASLVVGSLRGRWDGRYSDGGSPSSWSSWAGVTPTSVGSGEATVRLVGEGQAAGELGSSVTAVVVSPNPDEGILIVSAVDPASGARQRDVRITDPDFEIEHLAAMGQDLDGDEVPELLLQLWGEQRTAAWMVPDLTDKTSTRAARELLGASTWEPALPVVAPVVEGDAEGARPGFTSGASGELRLSGPGVCRHGQCFCSPGFSSRCERPQVDLGVTSWSIAEALADDASAVAPTSVQGPFQLAAGASAWSGLPYGSALGMLRVPGDGDGADDPDDREIFAGDELILGSNAAGTSLLLGRSPFGAGGSTASTLLDAGVFGGAAASLWASTTREGTTWTLVDEGGGEDTVVTWADGAAPGQAWLVQTEDRLLAMGFRAQAGTGRTELVAVSAEAGGDLLTAVTLPGEPGEVAPVLLAAAPDADGGLPLAWQDADGQLWLALLDLDAAVGRTEGELPTRGDKGAVGGTGGGGGWIVGAAGSNGFFDEEEALDWRCEDECLLSDWTGGTVCGETDHFLVAVVPWETGAACSLATVAMPLSGSVSDAIADAWVLATSEESDCRDLPVPVAAGAFLPDGRQAVALLGEGQVWLAAEVGGVGRTSPVYEGEPTDPVEHVGIAGAPASAADLDGDGLAELVLSGAVLRSSGNGFWGLDCSESALADLRGGPSPAGRAASVDPQGGGELPPLHRVLPHAR